MREQRKLAAVMAADVVVGYSRLMGRDKAGTLARLKEHKAERLEPTLARNGVRLVRRYPRAGAGWHLVNKTFAHTGREISAALT